MTQNIYDSAGFFEGYSNLPRSREGLAAAPEWPSMQAMLPALRDRDVLDLSCGFGWFCHWAAGEGAQVRGIDVSTNMLARARSEHAHPRITYEQADLETVTLPERAFDLVYSSLALHYVVAFDRLIAQVAGTLRLGGRFVFSMEHPILTAPSRQGWLTGAEGQRCWALDHYQFEGERVSDWLAEGVVKQHRILATVLNTLLAHGLTLRRIVEFCPDERQIEAHPEWADERHRPTFLLVSVER